MHYKHIKTGQIYRHLAHAIDCTNTRNGTPVVIYCPLDNQRDIYVREAAEHAEKFETLHENPSRPAQRVFRGIGELERTGYIPEGSAAERDGA